MLTAELSVVCISFSSATEVLICEGHCTLPGGICIALRIIDTYQLGSKRYYMTAMIFAFALTANFLCIHARTYNKH